VTRESLKIENENLKLSIPFSFFSHRASRLIAKTNGRRPAPLQLSDVDEARSRQPIAHHEYVNVSPSSVLTSMLPANINGKRRSLAVLIGDKLRDGDRPAMASAPKNFVTKSRLRWPPSVKEWPSRSEFTVRAESGLTITSRSESINDAVLLSIAPRDGMTPARHRR